MTKKGLLQNRYDMACHNLMVYSANYLSSKPKDGYEKKWEEAKNECELLEIMLNEYPKDNGEIQFIGTISTTLTNFSQEHQEHFIGSLVVRDRDDNYRMFMVDYETSKGLLDTYDIERHSRYEKNKDAEIIFTVNNFSQRIKRWEWKVK